MAHTHDVETMSERKAYQNHIKNLKIETRNVFERETSNENIVTQLDKTWLDNNQMTWSMHSSKHSKTYELGSNPYPEPLSYDSSESSSSDSRAREKKRTKKKKHRKHQKDARQTHLRALILIPPMTVIIDISDAKIRIIEKRIRSDYAQL